MIQHHNRLNLLKQFRSFGNTRPVDVNDKQHRIGISPLSRLFTRHQQIFRVIRIVLKSCHHRLNGRIDAVDDDSGLFIKRSGYPVDPDGRAEGVDIANFVTHNQQFVFCIHQFPHCMRFDAGFNTGRLLKLLGFSAVIADSRSVLDYSLIAAPAQSHVNGGSGIFVVRYIAGSVHTHTDAERNRHLVPDINSLNIFQKRKTVLLNLFRILLLDDKKIFILLELLNNPIHIGDIFVNLTVNQCRKKGASHLFHALQRLFIIIEINQARYQLLVINLPLIGEYFRLIKQIDSQQGLFRDPLSFFQLQALILIHINLPDINPVKFPVKRRMDAGTFLHIFQNFFCNIRKNSRQALSTAFVLFHNSPEGTVHPNQMAFRISYRIWHRHLREKLLLHPCIFCRKLHQSAHQPFSPVQEQPQGNYNIKQGKSRHSKAGLGADRTHNQVCRHQKNRQYYRPLQIKTQLALYFCIFSHSLSPVKKRPPILNIIS